MATHTWSCMCGNFEGQVKGDPALACWCHCESCRKQTGAAMQLGVFPELTVIKGGGDNLIAYKRYPEKSGVTRYSCKSCGSFCYKMIDEKTMVAPLGCLSGDVVKPTCHIFCADKGNQDVVFPDLPQHDAFP